MTKTSRKSAREPKCQVLSIDAHGEVREAVSEPITRAEALRRLEAAPWRRPMREALGWRLVWGGEPI